MNDDGVICHNLCDVCPDYPESFDILQTIMSLELPEYTSVPPISSTVSLQPIASTESEYQTLTSLHFESHLDISPQYTSTPVAAPQRQPITTEWTAVNYMRHELAGDKLYILKTAIADTVRVKGDDLSLYTLEYRYTDTETEVMGQLALHDTNFTVKAVMAYIIIRGFHENYHFTQLMGTGLSRNDRRRS